MDLIRHTPAFIEIVSDVLYTYQAVALLRSPNAIGAPSCFTDSQGIPTVVRFSDDSLDNGKRLR
jgi:hypothetical protein